MFLINEELLEPVARIMRFKAGIKYIDKDKPIKIVDLGCGPHAPFYDYLLKNNVNVAQYVGIDPLIQINSVRPKSNGGKIRNKILNMSVDKKTSLNSNTFDYVVGFAFIEHVDKPKVIIDESLRILKKGGKLILTTPTPKAKKFLEFLAYRLKLLSRREIEEHKNYFKRDDIEKMLLKSKYKTKLIHRLFELKLNNLFIVTKTK